jgi:hypothetical protein
VKRRGVDFEILIIGIPGHAVITATTPKSLPAKSLAAEWRSSDEKAKPAQKR